ncbi:MAG: SDR family oxidoreductase [Candidatus Thorarchaeota archaeon]|nr:SDR family oxidoreductase [Candidatus Thorarchaeota archaeon]
MDLKLEKRTILVTAASRGLGLGVAISLVNEGARAIICGRNEASLKSAVELLGENAEYLVADVSKPEDVSMLLEHVKSKYETLDGLFVNAGGPPPGTFDTVSEEDWESSFQLTLMSAVRLTKEALPLLKKSDSPSILYSTSISVKQPIGNLLLSNSMRPAVIGMMRTLAEEIGPHGIRVNAVCPGYINTERVKELMDASGDAKAAINRITTSVPLGRMGEPAEFGAVCTFLLSPVSSYVHGALLLVDGGMYKGMM